MFKVKNDLSPEIVTTDTFLQQVQTQYNLRHHNDFRTPTTCVSRIQMYLISWT